MVKSTPSVVSGTGCGWVKRLLIAPMAADMRTKMRVSGVQNFACLKVCANPYEMGDWVWRALDVVCVVMVLLFVVWC